MKRFLSTVVLALVAAAFAVPAQADLNNIGADYKPVGDGQFTKDLTSANTAKVYVIGSAVSSGLIDFDLGSAFVGTLYACVLANADADNSGAVDTAAGCDTLAVLSADIEGQTFTTGKRHFVLDIDTAESGSNVSRLTIRGSNVASSGGGGGSFDACRSGMTQGGGYSSNDGRWAWTCGNFKWREWQDAATANNASYSVTCTGEGTPHTSCLRSGEVRHIGYGLNVSVAAQYTRDGGRVYLPEGIYVDNGAGLNQSGAATGFPKPYDPSWEARSDFASLGYPTALRVILLNRGVRLIGEGVPKAATVDPNDSTVTDQTPKLTGTWIVDDRGTADASAATNTLGGSSSNIEPPTYYRMLVGGNPYTSYCHTTSDTDPTCITNDTADAYEDAQDAPNGANAWGVDIPLLADFSATGITACLPDVTYDLSTLNSQVDAIGTCSGNRMIRCWDTTDADQPRSSGGCNFGAGGNFGACEAPFEALKTEYTTNGQDLQLALGFSECADDASAAADCNSPLGWDIYVSDLRVKPGVDITGTSCATGSGTNVSLGNAWSTYGNDFYSQAIPFPNFYIGASTAANRVMVIKRGAMDGKGAGFENIGRMPANWLTRDSSQASNDCLSGGTAGDSDDETACDTDTLSAFAMSYNNLIGPNNLYFKASQYLGKSAIVETYPSGGPNDFIGNTIDTVYRQTALDWGWGNASFNTARNLYPWVARYAWAACYGGKCTFEGNRIDNSLLATGYLGYTAAEEMVVRNEKYANVMADGYFFNISAVKNFIAENIDFGVFGYHALGIISPGGVTKQRPTVSFKNIRGTLNRVNVASSTTPAAGVHPGGNPMAAFVIESDTAANSKVDTFKMATFDQLNIKSLVDDLCLVWMEDDRYSDGAAGGAVDTTALTRDSANKVVVMNSHLIGSGGGSDNPAIACAGQYRYIAAAKDADDSIAWATSATPAPTLRNNKVNNLPVADMDPALDEATLGLANTYPDGTEVRVYNGTAGCAHVGGNLTAGAALLTCVSDAGNTWAAK